MLPGVLPPFCHEGFGAALKNPTAGRMWNHKPFNIGWETQLCDTTISSTLLELSDHFLVFLEDDLMLKWPLLSGIWHQEGEDIKRLEEPFTLLSSWNSNAQAVGHTLKAFWWVQWTKGATTKTAFCQVVAYYLYGALMTAMCYLLHVFWMISRDAWFWKARSKAHCKSDWSLRHGFDKLHCSVTMIPRKLAQNQPMNLPKPSIRGHSMVL